VSEHAQAARDVERSKQRADEYRARSMAYTERGGIVVHRDGTWAPWPEGERRKGGGGE
jgi:hypothetical protein